MTQASRRGLQGGAIKALSAEGIPTNCTLVFSANQLRGRLAIGEALPEQLVFDGSLKDCIHIFSEQSIEEGSEQINAYLEQGAAEWTENGWEQFTCRTAVLGCCSGFYLSIVNKKDL